MKSKKFGFYGLEYSDKNELIFMAEHGNYYNYDLYKEYRHHYSLFYDTDKKKLVYYGDYTGSIFPAIAPCRSLAAAVSHLKAHNEIPKGTKFRLISKYVGGDIELVKR